MLPGLIFLFAASLAALQPDQPTLADAQSLFYNAHYEASAALTLVRRSHDTPDLANDELRTSALLFQLRALIEDHGDRGQALQKCSTCGHLIGEFFAEIHRGQDQAREALRSQPDDDAALFFLGKMDLNYVWLQLGLMGRKTGWDEYWEARRSLDAVLRHDPQHTRARIARAWIDYIVSTKMPWGTRWLLGGGDRKQALVDVRNAAAMDVDFFTHAEAEFALWDMCLREHNLTEATAAAQRLAHDFPDNQEVVAFLETHQAGVHHRPR